MRATKSIEFVDLSSHRMSEIICLKHQERSCNCTSFSVISADTPTAKSHGTIPENVVWKTVAPSKVSASTTSGTHETQLDPLWLTSQEFHDTAKILGMTVIKQLRVHADPIPTKATHPQPVRNDYHSFPALRHDYHLASNPVTRDTELIPKFSHYFKPLSFTRMTTGHCLPTEIPVSTDDHYFLQTKSSNARH